MESLNSRPPTGRMQDIQTDIASLRALSRDIPESGYPARRRPE
jgi:hypothetical protein